MKDTYGTIKSRAKARLSTNFGDAFLIILIPWIIALILNWLTTRIFPYNPEDFFTVNSIINQLVSYALGIYTGFIVIRLLLPYARGKNGIEFNGFFQFDSKFFQYAIYQIIIVIIQYLIALRPTQLTPGIMDKLRESTENPDEILDLLQTAQFQEWINALLLTAVLSIVFWIVLVKLRLVPYIIIDKDKSFTEAISMSWSMTNGNFFRILFFPLAFILWFLLIIVTCGLGVIYVAPLFAVAQVFLYLAIAKEHGMEEDYQEPIVQEPVQDPLDHFYE